MSAEQAQAHQHQLVMLTADMRVNQELHNAKDQRISGVKGAPGVAIGTIHLLSSDELEDVIDKECREIEEELEKFHTALDECRVELARGSNVLGGHLPGDVTSIFSVYEMLLDS